MSPAPLHYDALVPFPRRLGRVRAFDLDAGGADGAPCEARLRARGLHRLRLAGAAVLGWVALRALRAAIGPAPFFVPARAPAGVGPGLREEVVRGFLVHLANPKAPLGWIAVVAIGASSAASAKAYLGLHRPLEGLVLGVLAAALVGILLR